MRSVHIGVIAEEYNDIEVLYALTCKLTLENKFSFSKFVAHGCGKLRCKCKAWSQNLVKRGCSHIVVIHDLDDKNERRLRKELEKNIRGIALGHVILIPTYEIEAWLLSDPLALQQTFGMSKTPKVPKYPETVRHPKEKLRDIVWKSCKKRYINTIHNKQIASAIKIRRLSACPSFLPYPAFINDHVNS